MYQVWMNFLEALAKMMLALICGGVLGMERGRKRRPAGFRTYMLVCLGATLVMMTNQYICQKYGTGDYARMGAQVISGIGFLGAGTIITTGHNRVKGLTTAAGLWAAACIGLAIGIGFYEGAIIGTLMIVVIMLVLSRLDNCLTAAAKVVVLHVEMKKMSVIRRITAFAKENEIVIEDIEVETADSTRASKAAAVITVRVKNRNAHAELMEQISELEGVLFAEEIL